MAAPDLVALHNKAQFMSQLFEALAAVKQMPASLRNHLAYARSTCRHFLKSHFRLQRIAQQKINLDKGFDNTAYTRASDVLKRTPEALASASLTVAMGKVEEAVKAAKQPSLQESVDVLQEVSKIMPIPQPVLKPTLVALVNSGTFDASEVGEVAAEVHANPYTPDQVWAAVTDRTDALKDGRVASLRKQGKSALVRQNVTKAGYFQIVDVPKEKQFATMPITTALAAHMACGPQPANFTHLDACGHPAVRGLMEDLTNILLIGTNVADVDRDKSVAVTLRWIAQDPTAISFSDDQDNKKFALHASKVPGVETVH